jgi:hypothetical protein
VYGIGLARYLHDSENDYSFGTSGTIAKPGPGGYIGTAGKVITKLGEYAGQGDIAIAIQSDGKVVVAGAKGHGNECFVLARYLMQ